MKKIFNRFHHIIDPELVSVMSTIDYKDEDTMRAFIELNDEYYVIIRKLPKIYGYDDATEYKQPPMYECRLVGPDGYVSILVEKSGNIIINDELTYMIFEDVVGFIEDGEWVLSVIFDKEIRDRMENKEMSVETEELLRRLNHVL